MAEKPPLFPAGSVVETYFGQKIADPYRAMENFTQPGVQAWVREQARYAQHVLHALPSRKALLERIDQLDAGAPYTLASLIRCPNGDLYYLKQLATDNVAKIYCRAAAPNSETLLIDPETFAKQTPDDHFTISFFQVSPDGKRLLYGFAASGSEQTTIRVFDRVSGHDLADTIERIEAEYALPYWLPDSQSFVYSQRRDLPATSAPAEGFQFTQALQHTLGNDPASDQLIFGSMADGSPTMAEMDFPAVIVPLQSPWVIGQVRHGDETDITLYAVRREQLGKAGIQWKKVCDRADLVTGFAVMGSDIYLLTAANAPRFKIVQTSLDKPDFPKALTVVAASESVVDGLTVAKDALYVGLLSGVPQTIIRIPYDGGPSQPVPLPVDQPTGEIIAGRADMPGIFVRTHSWIREGQLYYYDPTKGSLTDTGLVPAGRFSAPEGLTATEVMVPSHDGVEIPLSIIHRTDNPLDGTSPTLLYGYGAYGYTIPIDFKPTNLAWLERGGVLAMAHVRGGGAFGKAWHHAGRKATKPNTWKDFIACGEYLVKHGYTQPARLVGRAGSAGGILIGRAITQRPDLFAAVNIAVGCTDMLRFETTTNGPPNIPEFGTVTQAEEFSALLEMSTIHHIQDGGHYPAILLTHGINDPRVEPWESAKTTARFLAATASDKPVLFRVDYHSGHGIGSTRQQQHEERADVWSFFLWQCGDRDFQPPQ